jgi:hypothetical protein
MKRQLLSRGALALHEAGHVVIMTLLERPGTFSWLRRERYEIAHVEAIPRDTEGWEHTTERNKIIARRVVVALAGGAAECCAADPGLNGAFGLEAIHAWTGSVDFQLAHEWLTLQRYDGEQAAIEADLARLFKETCEQLLQPPMRLALEVTRDRILAALRRADRVGRSEIHTSAQAFCEGISLGPATEFTLKATLAEVRREACAPRPTGWLGTDPA